jgi:hypothetical protein
VAADHTRPRSNDLRTSLASSWPARHEQIDCRHKTRETMPPVPPHARIAAHTGRHTCQSNGIAKIAVKQLTVFRANQRPTKFHLDQPVNLKSQRAALRYPPKIGQ